MRPLLLMAFYSVRSEWLFCEQLDYYLMFRWFLDMNTTWPGDFFAAVVEQARRTQQAAHLNRAASNLLRVARLIAEPT